MNEVMNAKDGLTVLSFGGGQDSHALLYRYAFDPDFRAKYAPGRFLVIMAATLDEHPETNVAVEAAKVFCREQSIEFVHITPDMGFHGGKWQGYRQFLMATNTCGSKAFRKTCTDNLKIKPIYRFLEQWLAKNYGVRSALKKGFYDFAAKYGKIKVLIGIAKGEESRCGAPLEKWAQMTTERVYPLIDLGMDRQGCQDYIAACNKPVPPPSNCMLCPFMSEIELLWLYHNYQADYNAWVILEQNKIDRFRREGLADDKNLGVWGRKLLPQKLQEAKVRYAHMTIADINEYKMSHGHCVKSKY
jgi:3'-phosphoadenosine 5'-phosphosulfate sulfotransferase (PAPS reductase)/FAD synthetase